MYSEDFTDFVRNGFTFLILFLVLCPALGDNNFDIQRMVQYEGSFENRAASAYEAKASTSMSLNYRSCVLMRFQDLTIEEYRAIVKKAGALIVVKPRTLKGMTDEEKENIYAVENSLLKEEVSIPVYFAGYDDEIIRIINEISHNPENLPKSQTTDLLSKINANIFHLAIGPKATPKTETKISIIQGELSAFKQSANDIPATIVISTQLKPFGITNDLPPNYDTSVFLTLIEAFSKLYNQMSSSAKYRLLFVLHESGSLLNYQGAKKFVDTNNIQNVEFALCLDTFPDLISSTLYLHSSKPMSPTGPISNFFEILRKKAQLHGKSFENVHKKINLADSTIAWGHEIFSVRRMPAFTLSSLKSHNNQIRTTSFSEYSSASSILESDEDIDQNILENIRSNTKILAEALAEYIYFENGKEEEVFTGPLAIKDDSFLPYTSPKSLSKNQNVKMMFEKFLKNVKLYNDKPDSDFTLNEGQEAKLNVYKVKPAVFDLFLSMMIASYLVLVYFMLIHFSKLYQIVSKFSTPTPTANGANHKNKVM